MFVYDLTTKGGSDVGTDSVQQSADCVIAVWPYLDPDTFNFKDQSGNPIQLKDGGTAPAASNTGNTWTPEDYAVWGEYQRETNIDWKSRFSPGYVLNSRAPGNYYYHPLRQASQTLDLRPIEVGGPVLLDQLLYTCHVRQAKGAHTSQTTLLLADPDNILLSLISPGDWMAIWITDNTKDAEQIRNNLKTGSYSELNSFNSGLKFLGKVYTNRVQKQVDTNSGFMTRRVQIVGTGFSELDTAVYYDPYMFVNVQGLQFMTGLNSVLNKMEGIPLALNNIMSTLLAALLGISDKSYTGPGAMEGFQRSRPLRVPHEIARVMGKPGGNTFYIDILQTYIGVQDYSQSTYVPPVINPMETVGSSIQTANTPTRGTWGQTNSVQLKQRFAGVGSKYYSGSSTGTAFDVQDPPYPTIHFTPDPLEGFFSPTIQPFTGVPIWGILQTFLNETVNEMYTTLRLGPDHRIYPSLIIRQKPFNTDAFTTYKFDGQKIPATPFRSLPRWRIDDQLVVSYDAGKSNATKANFVHIWPTGVFNSPAYQSFQRARNDPKVDATDIERNGLFPYIRNVNAIYDLMNPGEVAAQWTSLVTDQMMGNHLKLNGTMRTVGIQEPIAVGDNLEYDGFVLHIEQVEHSVVVRPQTGHKSFSTSLAFSSGVPAAGPVLPEISVREFVQGEVVSTSQVKHSNTPPSTFEEDE